MTPSGKAASGRRGPRGIDLPAAQSRWRAPNEIRRGVSHSLTAPDADRHAEPAVGAAGSGRDDRQQTAGSDGLHYGPTASAAHGIAFNGRVNERPKAMTSLFDEDDDGLPPQKAGFDDKTAWGRINGRDRRRYARLWGVDLDRPRED